MPIPHSSSIRGSRQCHALRGIGLAAALVGFSLLASESAWATTIEVVVNRVDGGLYLRNPSLVAETIDGYQIGSTGLTLDSSNWTSVTGNYDTAGDTSVDATSAWFVLATSDAGISEVSRTALSGSLDPGEIAFLGNAWRTGFAEDLTATLSAGVVTSPVAVAFRTLTADYDDDLDVDLDDHTVFASTYGSTVDLRADGNGDGVVDAIDYAVWRDSESLTLTSSALLVSAPLALGTAPDASPIPEPTTTVLVGVGVCWLLVARRWRNRPEFGPVV